MSKNIKILICAVLFVMSTTAFGTLLLEENFNYTVGTALTANGWNAHSATGVRPILVTTPGLTYSGYVSSGIGEATTYSGGSSGEDVNKTFTQQTSGSVYAAFMVDVTAATTTADYFLHFGHDPMGTTIFRGKVFVKRDAVNNLSFGLTKGSNTPLLTDSVYTIGTTYLLVLKYTFNSGSGTDDEVKLWVNPTISGSEPPANLTQTDASQTDLGNCGSIGLRQGAQAYTVQVDGIRIGTSWTDVLPGGGGTPTQLAVISVNGGVSPTVNTPFSVLVQAQDALGNPANVTANTNIALSLASGTGILGGALTGQIASGTNTVSITGVTYNTVQAGVSITATRTSGDLLTPGTSAPFTVLQAASHIAFMGIPAAAQPGIMMGSFTVEARRPDNSVDLNYTGSITIAKASGPGNVTGTLIKPAVSGIATFNDIVIDASGSYTIDASAIGLTGATSSSINVLTIGFPLIENFEYTSGTSLVYNGWSSHSAGGSNPVLVTTPGLTYTGYLSSGIGEAATINGAGEDVHKIFTSQTSGSVYAAFMINVSSAPTSWDYFAHLGAQTIGTTFRPKLFIKKDISNNLSFGLSKGNNAPPIDSTPFGYALNTTYLIVLKYTFIEGATNDEVKLWVNPSLTGPEPTANLTAIDVSSDLSGCGSFALRQSSSTLTAIIDGIRVGENWGIVNGSYPPTINNVSRTPSVPLTGDIVHVSAKIYDAVTALGNILDTLYYAVNTQASWTAVSKDSLRSSDSTFFYTIPALLLETEGDTVFYKIVATDGDGNKAITSTYRYVFPLTRTIDQIQGASSASPDTNLYIHTKGVVAGVFGTRFFIEQRPGGAWNGVYVYRRPIDSDPALNIGDSVTVVGVVKEYNTLTEINAGDNLTGEVQIISTARPLPDTTQLTIAGMAEDYEGCLIQISSLHFRTSGVFTQETNYWLLNSTETESLRIRVDSTVFSIVGQTIPLETLMITGNLSQYKDTFQLFPRMMSDFFLQRLDVGVTGVLAPSGTIYVGQPVTPKATVKNYGIATGTFPVVYTIYDGPDPIYVETTYISLTMGQELTVEFDPFTPTYAGGPFDREVRTALAGDVAPSNDVFAGGGFMVDVLPIANWSPQPDIPTLITGKNVKDGGSMTAGSSAKDLVIYAFRGNKSGEFYKYDGLAWTSMETLPYGYKPTDPTKINKKKVGKGASLCFDSDHTIYATKGNSTTELWAYDILANTWTAKAFVPVPKALKGGTSIAYLDGKVYLLAGGQKKTDLVNFYVYDIATDAWSPSGLLTLGPNIKIWKDGACLTVLDGTLYALKSNDKYNPFFSYNVLTNTWTEFDSIPMVDSVAGKAKKIAVKDGGAMCASDGAIYAIKGGGKIYFWKYTTLGGWTRSDTIPRLHKKSVAKTGAALAYANNSVYLLKGNNTLEMWAYGPVYDAKAIPQIPAARTYSPVMSEKTNTAFGFNLNAAPNPFAKLTTIRYTVPVSGNVSIKLFSANGRLVETIRDGYLSQGTYTKLLTTNTIAKGIYFLRYNDSVNRVELKLVIQ